MVIDSQNSLRVLVFGAGAIGTYIGGSLALASGNNQHQVVFLEKPEVVAVLQQRGLRLALEGAIHIIASPRMAASLEAALDQGPFDVAIFALKSFDTQSALDGLALYKHRMPPVLCLQNGVENEPALGKVLGMERVIAGTVTSAIGRPAPGDIVLERRRGIGVVDDHSLAPVLVKALSACGLNARLYPRAGAMKWSKLLTNLIANASAAILDMAPGEIFAHPDLYRLEIGQLREALAVMEAQAIHPVDLPGTPVRSLAWAVTALPARLSQPLLRRGIGGGRGAKMPSLHIDLHSGRANSEVDYLNGAVVRFGERFRIPTPTNRFLNETLLKLTRGELPLSSYARQPEKFLRDLREFGIHGIGIPG